MPSDTPQELQLDPDALVGEFPRAVDQEKYQPSEAPATLPPAERPSAVISRYEKRPPILQRAKDIIHQTGVQSREIRDRGRASVNDARINMDEARSAYHKQGGYREEDVDYFEHPRLGGIRRKLFRVAEPSTSEQLRHGVEKARGDFKEVIHTNTRIDEAKRRARAEVKRRINLPYWKVQGGARAETLIDANKKAAERGGDGLVHEDGLPRGLRRLSEFERFTKLGQRDSQREVSGEGRQSSNREHFGQNSEWGLPQGLNRLDREQDTARLRAYLTEGERDAEIITERDDFYHEHQLPERGPRIPWHLFDRIRRGDFLRDVDLADIGPSLHDHTRERIAAFREAEIVAMARIWTEVYDFADDYAIPVQENTLDEVVTAAAEFMQELGVRKPQYDYGFDEQGHMRTQGIHSFNSMVNIGIAAEGWEGVVSRYRKFEEKVNAILESRGIPEEQRALYFLAAEGVKDVFGNPNDLPHLQFPNHKYNEENYLEDLFQYTIAAYCDHMPIYRRLGRESSLEITRTKFTQDAREEAKTRSHQMWLSIRRALQNY